MGGIVDGGIWNLPTEFILKLLNHTTESYRSYVVNDMNDGIRLGCRGLFAVYEVF